MLAFPSSQSSPARKSSPAANPVNVHSLKTSSSNWAPTSQSCSRVKRSKKTEAIAFSWSNIQLSVPPSDADYPTDASSDGLEDDPTDSDSDPGGSTVRRGPNLKHKRTNLPTARSQKGKRLGKARAQVIIRSSPLSLFYIRNPLSKGGPTHPLFFHRPLTTITSCRWPLGW
jgi:hypothetical protein